MFMNVWVELFIIGWVNMFSVGWVDVYILSLAGAATSMSFVAPRLLSRQKYACHDKIMFVAIKRFFEANICRDKLTVVATKDSILSSRQKTYLQKSYLWQLPPMIIYWGQSAERDDLLMV